MEAAILRNKVQAVKELLSFKDLINGEALSGENIVGVMKLGYQNMAVTLINALQGRDGESAFNVNLILGEGKESLIHLCGRMGLERLAVYLLAKGASTNVPDRGGR